MDIFFQLNKISEIVNKTQQQYILNKQSVAYLFEQLLEGILPIVGCQYGLITCLPLDKIQDEKSFVTTKQGWIKTDSPVFINLIEVARQYNKPIFTDEILYNPQTLQIFQDNPFLRTLSVLSLKSEEGIQGVLVLGNFNHEDEFDLITLLKPITTACGVILQDCFAKLHQKANDLSQSQVIVQKSLSREEQFLKAIFNNSEKSIIFLNQNYEILFFNKIAEKNIGGFYQKEIHIGDNMLDFTVKDTQESFKKDVQQAFEGEEVNLTMELEILPHKKLWYEMQYLPIFDEQKKVQAVAFIALDITKNKKIETALRETYHEITNFKNALYSSALIIVLDLEKNIIDINNLACQTAGYEKFELLSKHISILYSDLHGQNFFDAIWNIVENGQNWRGEIKQRSKTNISFWTDTVINPVMNDKNEVYQYLCVNYLITERKLAEERQQKLLKDLYDFAFETSHGLRKPLANILGLVSVFDKANLSNEFNSVIIDKLQVSAEELDTIVLKMVKLLSGKNLKF